MEEIKPFWENKQLRQESSLLDLINFYDMFGFSVKNYSMEDDIVKLVIKDLTMKDSEKRLDELLTFLRPTWYKIHKRFIKLEYHDFNGNPISIIEADTSKRQDLFIEGVDENLLTLNNYKKCTKLTDLRTKN